MLSDLVIEYTYCSDGLHAENECVACQVARVRECVFLPQLSKVMLRWSHGSMVDGEVSYIVLDPMRSSISILREYYLRKTNGSSQLFIKTN